MMGQGKAGAAAVKCGAGTNAREQNPFGSSVHSPLDVAPSNVVLPAAIFEVDPVIATATGGSAAGVVGRISSAKPTKPSALTLRDRWPRRVAGCLEFGTPGFARDHQTCGRAIASSPRVRS